VWDTVSSLSITLGEETTGVANEYLFQFNSGAEATQFSITDSIKWQEDFTIEANKIYQISILNGLGTVMSWEGKLIIFFIDSSIYYSEEVMTWEEWVNSSYNTDGFYISYNVIHSKDGGFINENKNNIIIKNNLYQLNYGGGSGGSGD
jgi:hypothetical protein